MKKTILSILALLIMSSEMKAQSKSDGTTYKTALGGRFGYGIAPSFKTFLSEKGAIEVTAFFRDNIIQATALYLVHNDIKGVEGLKWYLGGGVTMLNYSSKYYYDAGANFGVVGAIGLDYKIKTLPINLSLDYQPYFGLTNGLGFVGSSWGGLAIRYVFK